MSLSFKSISIYSIFNKVESRRTGRGRKLSNNLLNLNLPNNSFDKKLFIKNICDNVDNKNFCHFARTEVMKLTKELLKIVFLETVNMLQNNDYLPSNKHEYTIYVIKDLCLYKLKIQHIPKGKSKYVVVNFVNKLVENVKFNELVLRSDIKSLFPTKSEIFKSPKVSYSYSNPIRNNILNYKETIEYPNPEEFACCCSNYPDKYTDNYHKHIFTGDLSIINNNNLKNLMEKGLGYHDQQPPNKEKAYIAFQS